MQLLFTTIHLFIIKVWKKHKEFPFFTYFKNQKADGKKYIPHKIQHLTILSQHNTLGYLLMLHENVSFLYTTKTNFYTTFAPNISYLHNNLVQLGETLSIYHEKIFNSTITEKEYKEPNIFSLLNE